MTDFLKFKVFDSVSLSCHENLLNSDDSLKYLYDRGISDHSIRVFRLGLFPKDMSEILKPINPKWLKECDIIKNASRSKFQTWDLIVPITDAYGRYIALAGRTMMSEKERDIKRIPKYMNSNYKKSEHMFGLGRDSIKEILNKDKVYVVEGYFDVISAHQNGLKNVVAICGAYLSNKQLSLLSRYTKNIVLMFDNEEEAQNKAKKIAIKKRRGEVNLSVENPLPHDAKDIDEFFQKYSLSDLSFDKKEDLFDINTIW